MMLKKKNKNKFKITKSTFLKRKKPVKKEIKRKEGRESGTEGCRDGGREGPSVWVDVFAGSNQRCWLGGEGRKA